MIIDGVPYETYARNVRSDRKLWAIRPLVDLIERKLSVHVLFDRHDIPFGRINLAGALHIAETFKKSGVLRGFGQPDPLPDEPPYKLWQGVCGDSESTAIGGASFRSDEAAFLAMLGEALERYLWFCQRDYFVRPIRATEGEIAWRGPYIDPLRFAAFSEEQRHGNPAWELSDSTSYLWIQGVSLITGKKTYLPAQTVSGALSITEEREPLIRMRTTVGMAAWPTQLGARLKGMLEVIERDAFMVMWLNQLTLPRIALAPLREKIPSLDHFLKKCGQYGLMVHAVRLLTDAPTHAVLAVIEDVGGHSPRFTVGLKAHHSLPEAIEGAGLEALRARRTYRRRITKEQWDPATPIERIGHFDRMLYWGHGDNAQRLRFLIGGGEKEIESPWQHDSPQEHLQRLLNWSRARSYECVAVPLGTSKHNPTSWHVEMVVMPDMQAMYVMEWLKHLGGKRLKEIPAKFGYPARHSPFVDAPHPFF